MTECLPGAFGFRGESVIIGVSGVSVSQRHQRHCSRELGGDGGVDGVAETCWESQAAKL